MLGWGGRECESIRARPVQDSTLSAVELLAYTFVDLRLDAVSNMRPSVLHEA